MFSALDINSSPFFSFSNSCTSFNNDSPSAATTPECIVCPFSATKAAATAGAATDGGEEGTSRIFVWGGKKKRKNRQNPKAVEIQE